MFQGFSKVLNIELHPSFDIMIHIRRGKAPHLGIAQGSLAQGLVERDIEAVSKGLTTAESISGLEMTTSCRRSLHWRSYLHTTIFLDRREASIEKTEASMKPLTCMLNSVTFLIHHNSPAPACPQIP